LKFHLNLRVSKHTTKEAAGKAPEYIVVLSDSINKKGRLEIRSSNDNIFSQLPLDEDFSVSLDNPQQTLDSDESEDD
jgi:hypothetical protein